MQEEYYNHQGRQLDETRDYSGLPVMVRLELLVGLLQDQLMPMHELSKQLKLRANAGYQTRNDLDSLQMFIGMTWQRLAEVSEHLEELKDVIANNGAQGGEH